MEYHDNLKLGNNMESTYTHPTLRAPEGHQKIMRSLRAHVKCMPAYPVLLRPKVWFLSSMYFGTQHVTSYFKANVIGYFVSFVSIFDPLIPILLKQASAGGSKLPYVMPKIKLKIKRFMDKKKWFGPQCAIWYQIVPFGRLPLGIWRDWFDQNFINLKVTKSMMGVV